MGRMSLYLGFVLVLIALLVGVDLLVLRSTNPEQRLAHHYYMALGDSLTFGYQPDLNFTDGFADKVFRDLQSSNVTGEINLACGGETTTSMIQGGCIGRFLHHGTYTGAQLDAAIAFLQSHPQEVSPVTLEIGSNDVLPDWHSSTCGPDPNANADLAAMDHNLTTVILPRLMKALQSPSGNRTGDLVMLSYYDPFAKECPGSLAFVTTFNQHLAADAAQYQIPIVDVYTAFGGDASMATNICQGPLDDKGVRHPYTWMCDPQFNDIHPTTDGYSVIAKAVELTLGYPDIGPALPGVPPIDPLSGGISPRFVQRLDLS